MSFDIFLSFSNGTVGRSLSLDGSETPGSLTCWEPLVCNIPYVNTVCFDRIAGFGDHGSAVCRLSAHLTPLRI